MPLSERGKQYDYHQTVEEYAGFGDATSKSARSNRRPELAPRQEGDRKVERHSPFVAEHGFGKFDENLEDLRFGKWRVDRMFHVCRPTMFW